MVQYRQLQSPAQLDTNIPDSGGAAAANTLARSLKAFENVVSDIGTGIQTRRGQMEGAAAGASGAPEFKTGFLAQTAYAQAYNNAALRSYAIQAEIDAEDQAARLEVEAANDPHKFAASFGAVRDKTIQNAPPMARAVLSDMYNQRITQGVARLSSAQAQEIRKQQRDDVSEGILRLTDNIANLRSTDTFEDAAKADAKQAQLTALLESAGRDGTLTATEVNALHESTQQEIVKQTVVARFQAILDSPYGDPIKFLKKLDEENRTSEILPPDEEAKLHDALLSALREKNALESAGNARMQDLQKAMYEEGDRVSTVELFNGTLTDRKLAERVAQQQLDPERASSLHNMLKAGDPGSDDQRLLEQVRVSLLDYTEEDIQSMHELSFKTRGDLILKRREEAAGWQSQPNARNGAARIDRKLGIVPGTVMAMLSEATKTQRTRALTEYEDRMAALPPIEREAKALEISAEVVKKFIQDNNYEKAEQQRRFKQNLIDSSNPEKMSPAEKAEYESHLQRYDEAINRLMQAAK